MSASNPGKPKTLQDTIQDIENQIALLGSGPNTDKKKEDLAKLKELLTKARQEQAKVQLQATAVSSGAKPQLVKVPVPSVNSNTSVTMATPSPVLPRPGGSGQNHSAGRISPEGSQVLSKRRLQDLVREIDPTEQLDDDVEELLLQVADDFIENVVTSSCQLAKHRKSNTLETKDVQMYLERNWNMYIPGFGTDDIRPYKKACTTEAHKQRMALIRKTLKK
ncbi:Transcription initiation factor TFIID subunit 12 [Branchiostoma belcheri]|nr:Transcription initiation factor TFIID subunit 12 [Branchiostoma belcheri]